ncbi:MAG: site-specific integrase [Syntrophomonas sp.]
MKRRTISQLAKGALEELEKQCYARISIIHYRQAFARIARYSAKTGEAFLSDGLAKSYLLDDYGWDMNYNVAPSAHISSQLRAIRILACYEESGCIPGRPSHTKEPPMCFKNHYDLYISECASRGLSDETVAGRSSDVCNLLVHAKSKGLTGVAEIDKNFIDDHLSMCSGKMPGAMPRVLSSLRCFLRGMFSNGVIQNDLSLFIPSASRYPTKPVQKLWTREEVKALLDFVDRSDSKGKRDYALMLLMVRYGMRVGDILNLKLTDIDWESMAIRFCQEKTSVMNVLPILDDVGWALADWITNARPKQANTAHVFTRLTAPYCGMKSLNDVFSRRMVTAGISRSGCGNAGPHSLRHALASNMLAEQVPLPVITAVLGHSTSTSTTVYLHSDIEGLRQCALDVEEGRQ